MYFGCLMYFVISPTFCTILRFKIFHYQIIIIINYTNISKLDIWCCAFKIKIQNYRSLLLFYLDVSNQKSKIAEARHYFTWTFKSTSKIVKGYSILGYSNNQHYSNWIFWKLKSEIEYLKLKRKPAEN